jgi:hypothetical protein
MNVRLFALLMGLLLVFGVGITGGGGGGGGGGGNNSNGAAPTGAINGSVSGTTVLAVDESGSIVASADTSGRQPDVDTNNDGTADAFSFQLTGIPLNKAVRIYLVHAGAIYPMYYDSDANGTFDTNVFSLTADTTIDLGFIDTSLSGNEGRAIPEHNPTENTSVSAGSPNEAIPTGINNPDTSGLTLDQMIVKGLAALADGWVVGARTYFEQAVNSAGDSKSNTADEARFMFALTRIVALGFDTLSDGDSSDMNRLGDILDRLGVANDYTRANWNLINGNRPASLPVDSPRGAEYQAYLYNVVRPELIGAVDNLAGISDTFNMTWTDQIVSGSQTESDYGDVLFLSGTYKGMLASIATQMAYDLDGDVAQIYNTNHDGDLTNDITVQSFLSDPANASFLSLADKTMLAEAKTYLTASALDDFSAAIDEIQAETDPQDDDLVTLDAIGDPDLAKAKIAQVKASILNGPTTVPIGSKGSKNAMLDLKHFFDDGVDFRSPSPLLPPFSGNNVSGFFPDATFEGVVTLPDLNADFNSDGIPDIVQ